MTIHFIGAGPGAADLLTLRAIRLLRAADVCVYAGTYLDAEVLSHCRTDCRLVDSQQMNLDAIIEVLVDAAHQGLSVARLCSGDPSVYSALAEQTRRLDAAGVCWDVCPGVPAYAAAAALLGRELTVPEVAQTVVLTRAQADSTKMPPSESIENIARVRGTLVLHLAIRHVRRLMEAIVGDYGSDCPAIVAANVSQPGELVLRGSVGDIAEQVEASGLRQAAVILVGQALRREDFVESHLYSSRKRQPAG